MKDMLVIDADGHVSESNASLKKFLKEEQRSRPLQASEAWNRSLDGTLGKQNEDPRAAGCRTTCRWRTRAWS